MLNFSEPGWFTVIPALPVLLWGRFLWRRRGGRAVFPYRVWGGEGFETPRSWLNGVTAFTTVLSCSGTAALITALAGPELTEREEVHLSRGIDIMIVLDQSPSMGAKDFPPVNRFDTAREMIRRFIAGRGGDSVGLVSFGSEAILRSPLTADYEWLIARLDELQLRELGDDTAVGMGLAVAILHLAHSSAPQRVILLLTDGDDNAGEIRPDTAAALAAKYGIRIYAVGIGSEGTSSIRLVDPKTGGIAQGTIVTRFDEEGLRSVADITGGDYWKAGSPGVLETVLQAVDVMESVERRVSVQVFSRPIHRTFILIGGIMLFFCYVIRKILLGEMP